MDEETFLTEAELATRWRMARGTLRNQRSQGRGVGFVKLGHAVRYPLSEVLRHERFHRGDL